MRYLPIFFMCLLWSCIPTYRLSRPQLVYNFKEGIHPDLHVEVTADSGSVIYTEFNYRINPAIELDKDLKSKNRNVPAGVKLSKMTKDGKEVYGSISVSGQSITYLSDDDKDGEIDHIMVQARKNSTNWKEVTPAISYKQVEGIKAETGGYELELIYHGKKDHTLTIAYREYKGDLTRASTTQKTERLLSKTGKDTITVRGARIAILDATSGKLTYKVLKGFDK